MSNYSYLLDGDISKFEEVFSDKKKQLEEFMTILAERAELEDYYSKGLQKIANSFDILIGKGSICYPLDNLRYYHAVKADQSKIFSNAITTDILPILREFIRTQSFESKKIITETQRFHMVFKSNLDMIEKTYFDDTKI